MEAHNISVVIAVIATQKEFQDLATEVFRPFPERPDVNLSVSRLERQYFYFENDKQVVLKNVRSMDEVRGERYDGYMDLSVRTDGMQYFELQEYFRATYHREYTIQEIRSML